MGRHRKVSYASPAICRHSITQTLQECVGVECSANESVISDSDCSRTAPLAEGNMDYASFGLADVDCDLVVQVDGDGTEGVAVMAG